MYCGGKVKLRGIAGVVAVAWMWDPGGGALGILAFVLLPAGALLSSPRVVFHHHHQSITPTGNEWIGETEQSSRANEPANPTPPMDEERRCSHSTA